MIGIVFAEGNQPTQQTNKLFLNPFYRSSMTSGTNYTYNITINPPDKISSVSSAIISFDVYMTPTVTFTLWVNDKPCNNPTFVISTTYSSSGQSRITFDCSNVITKEGFYTVTLKPTQANTGTISGWLDLTYMNNPMGELELAGTEYSPGDPATMFVQLKDNNGNAISNGSCYLDVWYPLNASLVHPYSIQDAPMLKAVGDDGIYYYDMVAPSTLGVYMLSAKCSYSFNWMWYYPEDETIFYPTEQINTGNFQGGGNPQVLNSRQDVLYERCDGTLANPCSANYTFNLSVYGSIGNISNINIYFSGQTDSISRTLTMSYWNGTAFIDLTNTLSWSGTGGAVPTSYDQFLTNSIPTTAIKNNTIKVRLITTGGTTRVFNNWLSLALLSSSGTIQDVKGSSEMHITNIPNATTNQVWNYSSRTLTSIDLSNVTINATVNINSSAIAESVWNYNGTIGVNLLSQIVNAVWNFSGTISTNILSLISSANWNNANRNLTYTEDNTNYSKISEDTWNYSARYTHGELA
jgi:hypothetical protein